MNDTLDRTCSSAARWMRLGIAGLLTITALECVIPTVAEAVPRAKTHQVASIRKGKAPVHVHRDYSKIKVPHVGYKPLVKEPDFSGIYLSDSDSEMGIVQRALRWRNITHAVEKRYGIPEDYLLGMICVESMGDPTKPNSSGDGGLGLIHMQPLLATKYGLDLITDSTKLRDPAQGRKIKKAIDMYNGDLKDLIGVDDRFHPIKNVDAAGRILADLYENSHDWKHALKDYAGRRSYSKKVLKFVKRVHDPSIMKKFRNDFAERNAGHAICGAKATLDVYVRVFAELNRNYGLGYYETLPAYPVK